jgi:hypothetical protein
MTRTRRFVAAAWIVFAFQTYPAFADRIVGVTATTTMGSGFGTFLINTVNGVGLTPSVSLTANHDGSGIGNSWVSSPEITTGTVTFALGGTYQVDSFSFWNQNGEGPGAGGTTGIQRVEILTSTDGLLFTLLAGPLSFAQVPSIGAPPQIFNFTPVTATHFRFNILSNYGDTAQTGFAEVGFNSFSVPETSILGLLTSGLMTLVAVYRRRK